METKRTHQALSPRGGPLEGWPVKTGKQQRGVTLLELLISIAVLGVVMAGFSGLVEAVMANYRAARQNQDIIPQARYAMERMAAFVQETDKIVSPETETPVEILSVNERILDVHNNSTRAYTASGDGKPDSDTDNDGLANEGGLDPGDVITFDLDKTDGANWRLMEQMPDYSTSITSDFKAKTVIAERVTAFSAKRLGAGLVEVTLTLTEGTTMVTLRTTLRARLID